MPYYRYETSNYYKPSFFGGFKFFPPVIKTLLISNVAIFFLANFFGMFRIQGFPLGPIISYIFVLYPLDNGFQFYQLITYMFMHGGLMHLLFNMFALWMFGIELENQWGSKKFLIYYLLCGIGAGLTNLFISPLFGPAAPTVGASGAIYGVLIAFGMMYPDRPIFVYFFLPIRAKYFVILYILIELITLANRTPDGIAHFAHLGGAAVGMIFILIDQRSSFLQNFARKTTDRVFTSNSNNYNYQYRKETTSDAEFFEMKNEDAIQKNIDEILDKISQHGYQSLTEEEKRMLFESSQKLN
jgi:membrane associated rhomboid family serine protease